MRKGTKKVIPIVADTITADEMNFYGEKPPKIVGLDIVVPHLPQYVVGNQSVDLRASQILSILIRICDACHEMDNNIEPWATIRKDIERLK